MPKEVRELEARIERLRERQRRGDADMTCAELQLVIDRVEAERQQLLERQPAAKETARLFSLLPRAAAEYRKQIELGLDGHARSIVRARHILRQLLGDIRLIPEGNSELWAE